MMRRFGRLLHTGNVVVDVVLDIPALPPRGGDVLASAALVTPGGGFNVMAAAARLGLPVAYAGACGTGPFASLALAALRETGVTVLHAPKPSPDTGLVISLVDADGERTFVTSPGAEALLTAQDMTGTLVSRRDAVYLSGYSLAHEASRSALLGWLPQLDDDCVVFFDPGPLGGSLPAGFLDPVLARTDWLTCSAPEAVGLTGARDLAEAARALKRRARLRGGGVLVRAGADGCLLATFDGTPVRVPGMPAEAVDTSGAGDTHTGAFIAALASGRDSHDAARLANAAAALSVTRRGPATAPTEAELTQFLDGT
jgi:sugar/nucleoside kinase (ribokinase family)